MSFEFTPQIFHKPVGAGRVSKVDGEVQFHRVLGYSIFCPWLVELWYSTKLESISDYVTMTMCFRGDELFGPALAVHAGITLGKEPVHRETESKIIQG